MIAQRRRCRRGFLLLPLASSVPSPAVVAVAAAGRFFAPKGFMRVPGISYFVLSCTPYNPPSVSSNVRAPAR